MNDTFQNHVANPSTLVITLRHFPSLLIFLNLDMEKFWGCESQMLSLKQKLTLESS